MFEGSAPPGWLGNGVRVTVGALVEFLIVPAPGCDSHMTNVRGLWCGCVSLLTLQ